MKLQLSFGALLGIVMLAVVAASIMIPLHSMFQHYSSALGSVWLEGYNGTGNASSYQLPYGYSYGAGAQ